MAGVKPRTIPGEGWMPSLDAAKHFGVAPITLKGIIERYKIPTKGDVRDKRVKYVDVEAIKKLLEK